MSHPTKKLYLVPLASVLLVCLAGLAHAGSLTVGYGGAGIYPRQASANSERYFRVTASWAPASEGFGSLRLYVGGFSYDLRTGTPATGVTSHWIASGTTNTVIFTVGPFAGRDRSTGQTHLGVIGPVSMGIGQTFSFHATFPTSSSGGDVDTGTLSYDTQEDNADILEWFSGLATGVDPLAVDTPDITADNGSSSSRYTFRVQYKIRTGPETFNLLPRFGTSVTPPGGQVSYFVDMDQGTATPRTAYDRYEDWWTYEPYQDDFSDQTGANQLWHEPEVVLIIDGDRTRPHYMVREDASDDQARDENGIRYRYEILPTDYANFMDNVFLYPYDPPLSDAWDGYPVGVTGRPVSNNYVAMSAGGHTYEFIATDDFSPPNRNSCWLQVGQPGLAEQNDYLRTVGYWGGTAVTTRVQTRFSDTDGAAGGFGYPYNSQDPTQYPDVNPVLSAHPYFPTGAITPYQATGGLTVFPIGADTDPFTPEVGAGPQPPVRVTNDDTILPNFVNIRPNTDPVAPFRGGKWTSASTFTFRINYWQSNRVAPQFVKVLIRKNDKGTAPGTWRSYTMEKADATDSDYTDGCVYQFQTTPDQLPGGGGPGDYNYQFQASDGVRTAIFPNRPANAQRRDPSDIGVPLDDAGNNDYYAFRVNHPPVLSNQSVSPASGRAGDNYRFSVLYTDADGEMLNAAPQGDRPFKTYIDIDLFGSPSGQARVTSVTSTVTFGYACADGPGYADGSLQGFEVVFQNGAKQGQTFLIEDNTTNTITIAAGNNLTTPAPGVLANDQFRIQKWFRGTMAPEDPADLNYADGKSYIFDTATNVELGPGLHRYHFAFLDDWGSWLYPDDSNVQVEGEAVRYPPYTGEFEGPEVLPNTPPVLTDFRFSPRAQSGFDGTTATPFELTVTYRDKENNPPALIRLAIDGANDGTGAIILNMVPDKPTDNVYTDGAVYKTPPVRLSEGHHVFRAQASDGSSRYPDTPAGQTFLFQGPPVDPVNDPYGPRDDSVVGPWVGRNTAPVLSFPDTDNDTVRNPDGTMRNAPGLDPNAGQNSTTFTYTVIYTDADVYSGVKGNPPDYVRVYIDNNEYPMTKVDATDTDYTNGAVYQYTTTGLVEGTPHRYYFAASDGLDRDRLPAFAASPNYLDGPVVDEPPSAPLDLLAKDTPLDNGGSIDLQWSPSKDDGGGAGDVKAYRVYRTTVRGQYDATKMIKEITATGLPTYFYQDTGATGPTTGVPYWYVLRAWDGANESVASNEEGAVTAADNLKPAAPTSVAAANPGVGGTIKVSWTPSTDDGGGAGDVKFYHIYRSTTTTFAPPFLKEVPAGTSSYDDTTAVDGTAYYYMVRAFDGTNESDDSTPPMTAPVTSTDDQAPVIDNLLPADRALDVAQGTAISFTVTDTGSGVDQSTLSAVATAEVNGVVTPVDLGTKTTTGTTAKLNVKYQPTSPFAYRAVVTVTVNVSDRGGKAATPKVWKFTVEGPPTYKISGTILLGDGTPLPNVRVTAGPLSALTGPLGLYEIKGLAAGNYTVKPVLRGYAFTPEEAAATVAPSQTGVDFTAQPGYDISGHVYNRVGNPLAGVTISDGVHKTTSDGAGAWTLKDLPAGYYNITPSLTQFEFTPSYLAVTLTDAAVPGQDFVGGRKTYDVSGTITDVSGNRVAGMTVTATMPGYRYSAVTNDSGQYQLADLLPGRWTLTPSGSGYEFQPTTLTIDVDGDTTNKDFVAVPIYALALPAGLSFTALPVVPQNEDPLAAFGAGAAVVRFDPAATPASYKVAQAGIPLDDVLRLRPGRGFWVRVPIATTARVPGAIVPSNLATTLQLDEGWNMVGNPYDTSLPWANLGVTSGGPVRDFGYIYDRATNGYVLVTDVPGLSPLTSVPRNAGMWMRSTGVHSVAVAPVSSTAQQAQTWIPAAGDFVIPIVAQAGGSVDSSARAGVVSFAKANPDAYDIENPPAVKPFVDVYFTSADSRRLTCDIRGESSGTLGYNFTVNTDMANTTVKVSLPDLSQVGRDKSVTLVDLATGKRLYARTLSTYSYNSGTGGAREFRLEVGPAAAGGLAVTAAAQPVGQGLGLTYTLSRPAAVEISIMNLSGRVVRTLSSGQPGTAGLNTANWDLRSNSGTLVPAGRYLIRIQAAADDGQQSSCLVPANVGR